MRISDWSSDVCSSDLATLASAYVIARHIDPQMEKVVFHSASGPLTVTRAGDVFTLDFPSDPPASFEDRGAVAAALGSVPREVLKPAKQGGKLLALLASEAEVRGAERGMERGKALPGGGLFLTARC